MVSGPGVPSERSFERALQSMLAGDEVANGLWRTLREFVARHGLEIFRRAQEHGLHLLPVHQHSPVPDTRALTDLDFREREDLLALLRVDVAPQLALIESIGPWAAETSQIPAEQPAGGGFYWHNPFFGELDALTYYCLVRDLRPRRIVEVGAGYSTLLAARAAELNGETELICIDPLPPGMLADGLRGRGRTLAVPVQRLPREFFDELGRNDILFVDSSHVSRIGSDVNFLVLEVLPRLRDGVVVHFHDVFLPHEYPREWIDGLAFLNEQYLLTAFLLFNERFEPLLFNHHLSLLQRGALERAFERGLPPQPRVMPSSLWLRNRAAAV